MTIDVDFHEIGSEDLPAGSILGAAVGYLLVVPNHDGPVDQSGLWVIAYSEISVEIGPIVPEFCAIMVLHLRERVAKSGTSVARLASRRAVRRFFDNSSDP
jgi:hypothetical protein